ncbi:exosortase family protein XrtF [Flavobacterium sp. Sd200]|uniref:exosortase family protein XrtF n=1 Tax=Flavobacterium sp. Sd200 TaxID=2692211 RepID=UPI00136AE4F6|nr:exosortase family protein XrtF [Flavobacterium sp. Sd200]MXN91009.1 exosortase family protein XrtF [Flavobacterium sp. Sd200]
MGVLDKNKPFFVFLAKFALSYLVLSGLYWLYLSRFDAAAFEPDGVTRIVAEQSCDLANFFGAESGLRPHSGEASLRFFVHGKAVARVVEGCNAVSVVILFAAFVVAFSGTFKKTLLYILAGILIIHVLNIIRIALICIGVYHYPQYRELLHDIIFPLFIYGVVFALWVAWVIKFRGNAAKV